MQSFVKTSHQESIGQQGFELWFQPAYDSHSGTVQHNEVLLRWRNSQGQLFLPREFMPWVSQANMQIHLDKLVLRKALQKLRHRPQVQLSINLSEAALTSTAFAQFVADEIHHTQVAPQNLKFEISERQAAKQFHNAIAFIQELKQIGCSVILDNFSNDHLTFMQWEKLGVQAVKIDGQAISRNLDQQERFLLTKAITDASMDMGLDSVAKSINEIDDPRLFEECNFGFAQGYQFKPPSQTLNLTSKVDILGVSLDNWDQQRLLEQLDSGIVFTPNVNHLMQMRQDSEYRKAYSIADYKLCNSQVLKMASQFLGDPLKEKIASSDIFSAFYTKHQDNDEMRLFIVGEGNIPTLAMEKINREAKRELVVDSYAPPEHFAGNELESERLIRKINQSGATTLVLGLSSPIQEKWVYQYQSRLSAIKLIFALGEGLAIEAGVEPEAPKAMSNHGVEWLYRFCHHPQKLWKRYLIDDAPFLWLLLKQKLLN